MNNVEKGEHIGLENVKICVMGANDGKMSWEATAREMTEKQGLKAEKWKKLMKLRKKAIKCL